MHKVTLITGDGIGPEVAAAAKECVTATGVKITWDIQVTGSEAYRREGDPLPERVVDSVRENKVALKAPITTPLGKGFRSANVRLRQALDLYACVRPARTIRGVPNAVEGVDLVTIRENTEGLYAGIEYGGGSEDAGKLIEFISETKGVTVRDDSGLTVKPISVAASKRIAEFAFDYARGNGRGMVTAVTKSNIMKHTDGVFMREAEKAAAGYSGVVYEHLLVDALCMRLVQNPRDFDVLLAPNLYGDILSDLCAGLTGGLGVAPGANIGDDCAVFEAVHGSAPDIAGKGVANPTALVLSAVMMLRHIGEDGAADSLQTAVEAVIAEGVHVTADLNPKSKATTQEMTDSIIKALC